VSGDWRGHVLKFWFGLKPEQWWSGGPELDHRIRQDFIKLWYEKRQLPLDAFLTDPLTALAAVILFDQFPRNMFRGHADAYSTDHVALGIAKEAIARGFDEEQIKYSKHHRAIIERFGRFPHRNAILGRASRPDEVAAGADKPW